MYRNKACRQPHAIATCFALARAWLRYAQNTVHPHVPSSLLPSLAAVPGPAIPALTGLYIVDSCPLVIRRLDE